MPLVDGISWHPFFGESPENDAQYYYDYPATVQAIKDLASGITMHLGMDILTGFGGSEPWRDEQRPEFRVARNLGTIMDSFRAASLSVQMQTSLTNTQTYTFSQGDDKLIGLWNDDIAVDFDPGAPTQLTIPGLGGYAVTAIDVLNGYRQPLVTENEGGNLVINDLLVLDYPILLQLTAP